MYVHVFLNTKRTEFASYHKRLQSKESSVYFRLSYVSNIKSSPGPS